MGQGQSPAAQATIGLHAFAMGALRIKFVAAFHVAKLSNVEMRFVNNSATQKNVRGPLYQALSGDDTKTLVLERGSLQVGRQYRFLGFLILQEERIAFVCASQEGNPATRSNAAHADHF